MIKLFKVHHPVGIGEKIEELFRSGVITEGEYSDRFEKQFADFIGNTNCSMVNSCTSALTLAYRMSGIAPGDEVISTPMTCMATNEPLEIMGAKIVWADIDPHTGNIDPSSVKKCITNKTRAIVGVHWAGNPFDINAIRPIAHEYGCYVIEDAAHALGSEYDGKLIGNHSDFVCFSFQAIKHLTTGDGGAICSKEKSDDTVIKKLKWFGLDRKYSGSKWEQDITESGYKFHMNNINSVIGIEQMKYCNELIGYHKHNGLLYDNCIRNKHVKKMTIADNAKSAYWIYTLLVEDRVHFSKYMRESGIDVDVVHVRNDKYSVFDKFKKTGLVGCDEFCSKMINIPVGWWLTQNDVNHIIKTVNRYSP